MSRDINEKRDEPSIGDHRKKKKKKKKERKRMKKETTFVVETYDI